MANKIERNRRFLNQHYYERGNTASRLLAIRLRKQRSLNLIHKLKPSNHTNPLTKPDEIAETFDTFFTKVVIPALMTLCCPHS